MEIFKIQEQLEILIPTYNRKPHITRTLGQLTAPESPVRTCSVTVLDNASDDGSSEAIAQFAARFSNIKHIRHAKNIGGNANIARAYELAQKPYVWVLCDDDRLDFSAWEECESLLQQHPAAVVVANYALPEKGPEYLFRQLSFVPAAIYRTDLITSDTLINLHTNVATMFPQLTLAAAAFNSKGAMPILLHPLVTMVLNPGNDSYFRGTVSWAHPLTVEIFWQMGYLQSVQLLNDPKLRIKCCMQAGEVNQSFYNFCATFMERGQKRLLYTYVCGAHWCRGYARVLFILCAPIAWLCAFFADEKGIYIHLFGKIKIRIWKFLKFKNT